MPDQGISFKVYRVGGREFSVHQAHDELNNELYTVYPDFEESPEYTDEGRPFATAGQESCSHCKATATSDPIPKDCGGCGWFYRETSPLDIIGICLCEELRIDNRER